MESLNKIIKGLECCTVTACGGCPYKYEPDDMPDYDCSQQVLLDAMEILKGVQNDQSGK